MLTQVDVSGWFEKLLIFSPKHRPLLVSNVKDSSICVCLQYGSRSRTMVCTELHKLFSVQQQWTTRSVIVSSYWTLVGNWPIKLSSKTPSVQACYPCLHQVPLPAILDYDKQLADEHTTTASTVADSQGLSQQSKALQDQIR